MTQVLRFSFVEDDNESTVDVFAIVEYPNDLNESNNLSGEIEDCIMSYCDAIEGYTYETLVSDVLKSFNLQFTIIDPITFYI